MVAAAAVFGFCAAYILVVSFAFPALLAGGGGAPRVGGHVAISYTLAFLVTVAGALWDITRLAASAFLPALSAARSSRCSGRGCAPPPNPRPRGAKPETKNVN